MFWHCVYHMRAHYLRSRQLDSKFKWMDSYHSWIIVLMGDNVIVQQCSTSNWNIRDVMVKIHENPPNSTGLYQPPAMDRGGWTVSLCHGLRLSLLLGFSLALRRSKSTAARRRVEVKSWGSLKQTSRSGYEEFVSCLIGCSWQFQVVHGELVSWIRILKTYPKQ